MNRTLRRRLARAKKLCSAEAEPDPAGLQGQELLLWEAKKYGLEALVMQACAARADRRPPDDAAREEPKVAAVPAASQALADAPAMATVQEMPPEPQWWEEKCRWRERGARDLLR